MGEESRIRMLYVVKDSVELNLSYIPFIKDGGLFVPRNELLPIGTEVLLELQLPQKRDSMIIETKVVWVTPKNALHYVFPGIGLQFIGDEAQTVKSDIESELDPAMEVGGYTYGVMMGRE